MALQIKVEFRRVRYITIDDSSGEAVAALPVTTILAFGEEADMMALSDHNNGDLRVDAESLTRFCS